MTTLLPRSLNWDNRGTIDWVVVYPYFYTLQEHQAILTNATISQSYDSVFKMVFCDIFCYYFEVFRRNYEMCARNNTAESIYYYGL